MLILSDMLGISQDAFKDICFLSVRKITNAYFLKPYKNEKPLSSPM